MDEQGEVFAEGGVEVLGAGACTRLFFFILKIFYFVIKWSSYEFSKYTTPLFLEILFEMG